MSKTLKAAVKAELIPRRINIIILLCMFAAMPVTYLLSGTDLLDFEGFDMGSAALAILIYLISLIFGSHLCVSLFSDCHRGENADIALSLPVSAEERFIAKGIIFALVYIVPYITGTVIILIIAFVSCIYYGYSTNELFMPWLSLFYEGLVAAVSIMGISFVCSALASSAAEALAGSVLAVLSLSLLPLGLYSAALNCAHIDTQEHLPSFLGCFGLDGMELLITEGADRAGYYISGLVNMLFSILLMIIALKVYIRRDRKTITENHYSKPFMLALFSITAFTGAEMAVILGGFLGFLTILIAGLAIYLLIITKKGFGFRKSRKWLVSFAVLCAGFLIMNIALIDTEGFHMSKLPKGASEEDTYSFQAERKDEMVGSSVKYYHNEKLSVSQLEKAHKVLESFEKKATGGQKASDYILNGLNDAPAQNGTIRVYTTTYQSSSLDGKLAVMGYYIINESDYDELIEALYNIT